VPIPTPAAGQSPAESSWLRARSSLSQRAPGSRWGWDRG